jgi:hypothetical protein
MSTGCPNYIAIHYQFANDPLCSEGKERQKRKIKMLWAKRNCVEQFLLMLMTMIGSNQELIMLKDLFRKWWDIRTF